jgi:hypothetical protein
LPNSSAESFPSPGGVAEGRGGFPLIIMTRFRRNQFINGKIMKRKIYIFLVMFLCALLVFCIFSGISLFVFNQFGFYLFIFWPLAVVAALFTGTFGGLFLGKAWWKFVYIDRCGGMFKRRKK